ncbi:hypothetical protein TSUD_98050 [Trifolium subterraneum]|uniref:Uncharacterized protein n=1 Tax=Trifolium subterraneum TaxID=3900 RepID=A0A2Z6P8C1_TRISU|nr:hypothetical protein TSUD_98050 [Trifolium subterraneum]
MHSTSNTPVAESELLIVQHSQIFAIGFADKTTFTTHYQPPILVGRVDRVVARIFCNYASCNIVVVTNASSLKSMIFVGSHMKRQRLLHCPPDKDDGGKRRKITDKDSEPKPEEKNKKVGNHKTC